jgi:flagellar protein FliS
MDIGGQPAQALSEFYAAIFAQILQASQSVSREKFLHAIGCVRNVREAWRQVAQDPGVNAESPAAPFMPSSPPAGLEFQEASERQGSAKDWTA